MKETKKVSEGRLIFGARHCAKCKTATVTSIFTEMETKAERH
jgi:hypothetical protein